MHILIRAIDRPLGFFGLALLVVEAFLGTLITMGNFPPPMTERLMWGA